MKHRRNTKNKAGTEKEADQKPRSKVPGYIAVAVFPDDWMWSCSYQQPEWRGILPRCHGSGSSVARVRTPYLRSSSQKNSLSRAECFRQPLTYSDAQRHGNSADVPPTLCASPTDRMLENGGK